MPCYRPMMASDLPGLRFVGMFVAEPNTVGGMNYGPYTVIMRFPKRKRPSRGWRRHIRRAKALR